MAKTITLTEDIIDLPAYFKELDYKIAPNFPEQFFDCYQKLPKSEKNKRTSIEDFEDIISVLLIKNLDQCESFHDDFQSFVKRKKIITDAEEAKLLLKNQKERQSQIASLTKSIMHEKTQLQDKQKKLESSRKAMPQDSPIDEKQLKSIDKLMGKNQKKLAKFSGISVSTLSKLHRKQYTKIDQLKRNKKKLKQAAILAFADQDYKELLKLIEKLIDVEQTWIQYLMNYKSVHQEIEKLEKGTQSIKNKIKNQEKKLAELQSQEDTADTVKIKGKSQHNRLLFRGGGAVIQYESDPILNKDFSKLKPKDMQKIEEYLRIHAQQFRTHLIRNIHASAKRIIDVPATCKRACATGGIPVRLEYVKPKMQKAKMVMFLDVSGSCKNASSTMLSFMKTVTEVFGGGVKSYCFVNSLYDVSDMLYDGASVESVLSQIPTKGVYSNYYEPMKQFVSEHMSEITKDTILLYIGDARNNQNANPEELFKQAVRRAKSAYWINTEPRSKWDYKDSIISTFSKYTNCTETVMTTHDLIAFLLNIR